MKRFSLRASKIRFFCLFLVILVIFAGVFLRLGYLQLIRAEKLAKMSTDQLTANVHKNNPRGTIVDRNGEQLATSIMTPSLYVDPFEMKEGPKDAKSTAPVRDLPAVAAKLLAPVLHISEADLLDKFTTKGRFLWVKRTIDPKEADQVKKIIKDNKLPGLHFIEESKRYYTKKRAAAHVLGFVGTDDVGLSGIELALDANLRGSETRHSTLWDALGHQIHGDNSSAAQNNLSTVYLTIDSKMQYVLEDAMDDAIARTQAAGAAAIIMDPYTGEILGMTSRPTFDPNNYGDYPSSFWFNRAVSLVYEPGSVFKPIVGCIGLTLGKVAPSTPIYDGGHIRVADRVIQNWDGEGMGTVTFTDVIKYSINTGMVQLGMRIGKKNLMEYAKKFGFGSATGIDLPGEEDGILYNWEDMWDPDLATASIGQGIAVTPIQVLRAICAIANGGELVQPYIVQKIVAPNGSVIKENSKKVVRNVISSEVAEQMRGMMEKVVSEGGGKTAAIKGYRIAGKTGTAEKLAEGGGYASGKYIASFVGFVPADKPKYAMLVIIDTPQGGRFYGSQVSAPIFKDTLQQILVAKGIQPSSSEGLPSFEEYDAISHKSKTKLFDPDSLKFELLPNGKIKLPSFQGIDLRSAADVMAKHDLRLKPYGSGTAYQQKPTVGAEVDKGSTVELWFN